MRVDPAWLEELSGFLRIPSVSADPAHEGDVVAAAEWLAAFVRAAGGEAALVPTRTPRPLVVGEIPASTGPGSPTVLVYGHFDVQPPGDLAAWDSPPFAPEARDGWLYGRGTADDKGNLYLVLKAAAQLAGEGTLPVTVRVVCDGEEEVGGDAIVDFLLADERGADAAIIFDSNMPRRGVPVFVVATRGVVYYHLHVRTGARDLHSGMYGGAALNAMHALLEILQAVVPTPEALQDGAAEPTREELDGWQRLESGASVLAGQEARPADASAAEELYLRTFARAAVDVNGIRGGEADLQKTVLPVEAQANLSVRLAPGQDAAAIDAAVQGLLRAAAPTGTDLTIERWALNPPGLVDPQAPAIRLGLDAFERATGARPLLVRTGGTLPIVPALSARGIPVILSGFDLPEGNIHSPNERLLLEHIPLGIAAARETLLALGALA